LTLSGSLVLIEEVAISIHLPSVYLVAVKLSCRHARERQKKKENVDEEAYQKRRGHRLLEQAVAAPTLDPCVTIASGNRWPPLDKRSVKLSSPPPAFQSTFANRVLLRQTLYNLSHISGTFTNGAQLTPKFISKRRQSFRMLTIFNKHNVRQHSPANINSYKPLATFTSGTGRLSKRRSKRRSVNPA